MKRKIKGDVKFQSVGQILGGINLNRDKYISREFQSYGYRLAEELGDIRRKALYIKLAKDTPREILEKARLFVKSAANVRNRGKLFMWKLGEIRGAGKGQLMSKESLVIGH
ncbi:MAG: hypothetical protein Q8N98_03370 [bacterium]|nr:hypothetical protein [bacterium]